MTEENKKTDSKDTVKAESTEKVDDVSSGLTDKVIFGSKEYTIQRLKAGKFYDALKVYMAMIREIAPETTSGKGEADINMNQLVTSMFESWPEKTAEFVAICCTTAKIADGDKPLSKQFILDNAYPEEISNAFQTCLKLNQVQENLKNFVAPIGELGAVAPDQKK